MGAKAWICICLVALMTASGTWGFSTNYPSTTSTSRQAAAVHSMAQDHESYEPSSSRRSWLQKSAATLVGTTLMPGASQAAEDGDDESFASIAARASKLSSAESQKAVTQQFQSDDGRTVYDFDLPMQGDNVGFSKVVGQDNLNSEDSPPRVKAILMVNLKQDDPIARKDIPELISLAAKYGRSGDLAVVMSPSDQGYFEPDTSALIRLKLASEYGYGINPATVVTDKVNFLGTGAHPLWRWVQRNCRTPAGLGRIEGNFEKFLIDGRTGLPLRRYPRKYMPLDMRNDIEAVIAGRPLPPAGANYLEQWRQAAVEAERDTYRFQKGLNYFDQ